MRFPTVRFDVETVPVAVTFAAVTSPENRPFPCTERRVEGDVVPIPTFCEKYERPNTSRILFDVVVALPPTISTSDVSDG